MLQHIANSPILFFSKTFFSSFRKKRFCKKQNWFHDSITFIKINDANEVISNFNLRVQEFVSVIFNIIA